MSRRDDINKLYMPSQQLGEFCRIVFWGNCVFSVTSIFVSGLFFNVLSVLQIASALIFVTSSLIDDGLFWYDAESERRKNSVQNAFGVRFSELETDGYYNNAISPSILKYAMNSFESNYFSKFIAGKMLAKSTIKSIVAIVLLISVGWVISDGSILLAVSQAVFSAYVIEDTVLLAIFVVRLNKLYDEAYSTLVTTGIHRPQQIVYLLLYCVEYESIKAHYKVRLDSNLFSKYNPELSEKWEKIASEVVVELSDEEMKI